jgi:hypothetical protein
VRKNGAKRASAAGVADARRIVSYDKNRLMPHILKLAKLVENNHMPEREVGTRGVYAEFDAQLFAGSQLFFKILRADKDVGIFCKNIDLIHINKKFKLFFPIRARKATIFLQRANFNSHLK